MEKRKKQNSFIWCLQPNYLTTKLRKTRKKAEKRETANYTNYITTLKEI